jgi:hypothetical protein
MNAEGDECAGLNGDCDELASFQCVRCESWFCGQCLGSDTVNSPLLNGHKWTLLCDLCDECSAHMYSVIKQGLKN